MHLPRSSAATPIDCPNSYPCAFQRPDGSTYFKEVPCNGHECASCRSRRAEEKIQKVHEGLPRSEVWQQTPLNRLDVDYDNQLRVLLGRINEQGLWYAAVEVSPNVRWIFHEP